MSSDFPIEKGVPKPQSRRGTYPWAEMEIGDSFFSARAQLNSMKSSAWKVGKALGRVFETHPEANGTRTWRVR